MVALPHLIRHYFLTWIIDINSWRRNKLCSVLDVKRSEHWIFSKGMAVNKKIVIFRVKLEGSLSNYLFIYLPYEIVNHITTSIYTFFLILFRCCYNTKLIWTSFPDLLDRTVYMFYSICIPKWIPDAYNTIISFLIFYLEHSYFKLFIMTRFIPKDHRTIIAFTNRVLIGPFTLNSLKLALPLAYLLRVTLKGISVIG